MIRIPLTFHAPEVIYEYLEKKVGPHNMLIKKAQALVTFLNPEHNEIALRDFKCSIVKGFPLRLFPYQDGDLNALPANPAAPIDITAPPQPVPTSSEMIPEPMTVPTVSETARIVQEAIRIKDPNDLLETATKRHFKEVIESVAKYQPLLNAAKAREKELMVAEGEKSVKELLKFAETELGEVKSGVMGLYKKTRQHIARFGKEKERCEIDLDPALRPQPVDDAPLYTGKLESNLHFSNKDANIQLKKLAALNERQFVCTNYLLEKERKQPARGRIKVYDLEEEYELMSTMLPEGAYGLAVIDKYLLVGNLEGSLSFWNSSQGPFSSDHPFQISPKLHDGYIFELMRNGTTLNGFGIVTLGLDYNIKVFQVSEDLITEDVVTLFFREEACFSQGREIMAIELMEERGRLVAGSWNKLLTYDLPTRKQVSQSIQKANIYRIKRMGPQLLAVANTSHLSFADPRTTPAVATCPLSQEVKALCTLNEHVVAYGTSEGELGMVDLRRPAAPFWRDQGTHHSRIYDILKMGDRLVSGDQKGLLVGWNSVSK